jgi:predicted hydrocarbon binding protein
MHSLAKKFMMARKLNFEEDGTAELLDDRVFLMDSDLLRSITETVDDTTAYTIGRNAGESLARNVRKTGIAGTKMSEFIMDLLTMMGIGHIWMHDFDMTEKEGEIRVENCIIPENTVENELQCGIVAGVIAGVFTQNYDTEFAAEEHACIGNGDDLCRFSVYPS